MLRIHLRRGSQPDLIYLDEIAKAPDSKVSILAEF